MTERGRDLKAKAIVAIDGLLPVLIGAALVAFLILLAVATSAHAHD
jgi:hypothetical protein